MFLHEIFNFWSWLTGCNIYGYTSDKIYQKFIGTKKKKKKTATVPHWDCHGFSAKTWWLSPPKSKDTNEQQTSWRRTSHTAQQQGSELMGYTEPSCANGHLSIFLCCLITIQFNNQSCFQNMEYTEGVFTYRQTGLKRQWNPPGEHSKP